MDIKKQIIIRWIAIIFVINVIMSSLLASVRGFILVDLSTAIILGTLMGYILKSAIHVNKYKTAIASALVLIFLGMSFGLHYYLLMTLLSTTIGHTKELWWYVF